MKFWRAEEERTFAIFSAHIISDFKIWVEPIPLKVTIPWDFLHEYDSSQALLRSFSSGKTKAKKDM